MVKVKLEDGGLNASHKKQKASMLPPRPDADRESPIRNLWMHTNAL